MSEQLQKWSFWAVSDADEPGDAVYTGMRHRDFDGATLVLWPDAAGWLVTDATDQPARPLLLFFRGGGAVVEDALTWLAKCGYHGPRGQSAGSPTTFEDYEDGKETTRSVDVHLNYPPYPWLEEAKLGMEMGRYFDRVELADWTEPCGTKPGTHTFRFFRGDQKAEHSSPLVYIDDDDLPF